MCQVTARKSFLALAIIPDRVNRKNRQIISISLSRLDLLRNSAHQLGSSLRVRRRRTIRISSSNHSIWSAAITRSLVSRCSPLRMLTNPLRPGFSSGIVVSKISTIRTFRVRSLRPSSLSPSVEAAERTRPGYTPSPAANSAHSQQ
jgi:hypothetical protein